MGLAAFESSSMNSNSAVQLLEPKILGQCQDVLEKAIASAPSLPHLLVEQVRPLKYGVEEKG